MTFADFMTNILAPALARNGIVNPSEWALFMAMAHQESKALRADRPTRLASDYNNPFGVQWFPRDEGRYPAITFAANQFDSRPLVPYRVYRSIDEAVRIERINKILRPQLYADCKRHAGATGYPGDPAARPNWANWLRCIARIHCPENPDHVKQVHALYINYLEKAKR